MASPAADFQKIITDARERKKNSALADRIFNRDRRRQSAPPKLKPTHGGSLASRVGVKKQRATPAGTSLNANNRRASLPAGNVDGDWTHDLHDSVNSASGKAKGAGFLSSRISVPGSNNNNNAANRNASKRKTKLAAALAQTETDQVNIVTAPPRGPKNMGLTIRGLAGPFAVMGQNFAPGTTAADIESAMTPVGGDMISCNIVKTSPFLLVEMVFASREGGERAIETFNDKTADGRVIRMYPKVGGYKPPTSQRNEPPANAPSGPKNSKASTRDHEVVDGSMGFPDLVNTENKQSSMGTNRLYSDRMVGGNRRGRGPQRARGGGR
ncbi:hypothetical protein QQS21_008064 [Conoideocrella luteorostrata]|uniref:RNA-binding protein n=1 Tax=Conoideocrella luteorostrata TaxID=1105319 RepID=A0AAJ0FRS7_9HYPO|nr:hypothetical protein QQS21_008064 [Conoideocrella luteorostrata]